MNEDHILGSRTAQMPGFSFEWYWFKTTKVKIFAVWYTGNPVILYEKNTH